MIDIVGTLGQSLISGFCMLLLASCCSALFYPLFRHIQTRLSIAHQALSTLCFALVAPLSALLGVVVLSHPAISATVVYAHCHGDNCAAHIPAPIMDSLSGAGLGALATLFTLVVFYLMSKRLHSAHAKQLFLDALARPEIPPATGSGKATPTKHRPLYYKLIESEDLIAWCAGLLFPTVYISSGLVNKLNNVQLSAVLAHEYGHVSRRDNLRKLLLSWSSVLWLPTPKKAIREEFTAQTEQLSDLYSARITGDPQLVNKVYALFRSTKKTQNSHYAHRNSVKVEQALVKPANTISTIAVYLLTSTMFIALTVGLTIVAHVLLENL